MKSDDRIFLGIDIGTGGVRTMAVGETGEVVAVCSVAFGGDILAPQQGRHEQPPQAWWRAACQATAATVDTLAEKGIQPGRLTAVAVDGIRTRCPARFSAPGGQPERRLDAVPGRYFRANSAPARLW